MTLIIGSDHTWVKGIIPLYFRDHVIPYGDELKAEDFATVRSAFERLIRTELSTLIGLMLRAPIDFSLPSPDETQKLIDRTEQLLSELHQVLATPMRDSLKAALAEGPKKDELGPFVDAAIMREPIFYGAESAFAFQYRDLAVPKYARDEEWLQAHKGFSPQEGQQVVAAICDVLNENLLATLRNLKTTHPDKWTFLGGFTFSTNEIVSKSGLSVETVEAVTSAFSNLEDGNPTFTSLQEFNSANAYPIIGAGDGRHIVFLPTSLCEALYDTPFYWMGADAAYAKTAMQNRGLFTEEFTAERLRHVFGPDNVYSNVDIWETGARKKKLGEIDTLVLFADRAIVVQAKSKKLTLLARKGNDLQLQTDFKGAVQDSCDQALLCSNLLLGGKAYFADAAGTEISLPMHIKRIHPVCVVSDHYPALSAQARQFLEFAVSDAICAPLVCDVFFIDVVTEFLDSPLRSLSYLDLRAKAGNDVLLSHEITALGFHLKQNLWLGDFNLLLLDDDISTDVNIAMAARREGVPGKKTPPGILTYLQGTPLGHILAEIETRSEPGAVGVGLELLKLSGESTNDLNLGIKKIAAAARDGRQHDITIALAEESGITVHCNSDPDAVAQPELGHHCETRKYTNKAHQWCGLSIVPETMAVRFGLMLDYPWEQDDEMDAATAGMAQPQNIDDVRKYLKSRSAAKPRPGRNQPCHCGSGKKYKKCCLTKDEEAGAR